MGEEQNILGQEKISRLLLHFALPSVVCMVLNAIYNMVDQIFIGQGVGYLGNAATNVIFPLTQLAVACGLLCGDGAAAFMNIRMGQGKIKESEYGMAAGVAASVSFGMLFLVVGSIFLPQLCALFGATEQTMPFSIDYGRIICIGLPFSIFDATTMAIVRADGSPVYAMMGMVTGCVINLIGDPVTILVLGWGVKGAALATILGQIANAVINAVYLARMTKSVKMNRASFHPWRNFAAVVMHMGLPSFWTQICIVFVLIIQNNLLVYYGAMSKYGPDIPMAALGVTMKIFTILQCAVTGLCSGSQPIISYNYGSGQNQRVRQTLRYLLVISVNLFAVATIWFQIAPMTVVRLFGSEDSLYNEYSVLCLRRYLSLLVLDAFQMVACSFLRSIGKSGRSSALIIIRQLAVNIPAMILCGYFLGVDGMLYSGPVASSISGILAIAWLWQENRNLEEC